MELGIIKAASVLTEVYTTQDLHVVVLGPTSSPVQTHP